jgi:hypothetical protein
MRLDGVLPPLVVAVVALALLWCRRAAAGPNHRGWHWSDAAAVALMVMAVGGLERGMGRPWRYRHGPTRIWSGDIASDQNSQQAFDPYTFTHIVHGALFYGVTRMVLPGAAVPVRLLVAVAAEAAWETYENTDQVVERYRAVTIALGYYGDSVLNSLCDVLACIAGFWLTSRLRTRVTVAWVLVVEVALALWIRDNLTLNILMLIHPLDVVRAWQAGM